MKQKIKIFLSTCGCLLTITAGILFAHSVHQYLAAADENAGAERIIAAFRSIVAAELRQPVGLTDIKLKVERKWAFIVADIDELNGRKIDWSITPYPGGIAGDDCGGNAFALLEYSARRGWDVIASRVCSTDASYVYWPDRYGAPRSLFPGGLNTEIDPSVIDGLGTSGGGRTD
jgi:hypothetical protein